jgi:hypothetical protein
MKLILKARVQTVTGKTRHAIGKVVEGVPLAVSPLPAPDWVGIATTNEGFFLLHFNSAGGCFNDTWHESIEKTKGQAEFEFEISEGDWQPTDESIEF